MRSKRSPLALTQQAGLLCQACEPSCTRTQGICESMGTRILPEMMKYGGEAVTKWLHHIIARVWNTGVAPADRKKTLIVPVLKKGNPAELDNYRGISLLSIPGKIYALILRSRLENWAEGIMSETQSRERLQ